MIYSTTIYGKAIARIYSNPRQSLLHSRITSRPTCSRFPV